MEIKFNVETTCDLEHYVVQMNVTGETDGWVDITKDFDTYEEALGWAGKIKDDFGVYTEVPF